MTKAVDCPLGLKNGIHLQLRCFSNKNVPPGSPTGAVAIDIPHITTWEIK
jgi:hypothetical protein